MPDKNDNDVLHGDYDGDLSRQECIAQGTHMTSCDDDGYCNACGEQE
jgi:hypothetical protein